MKKITLLVTLTIVILLTIYLPKNKTSKRTLYGVRPVETEEIKYWESLSQEEKKKLYLSDFNEEDYVGYLVK